MTRSNTPKSVKLANTIRSAAPKGGTAFGAAYDRRLAEIMAVRESELIPINLDVQTAIATVLGSLPRIALLKDRFACLLDVDQAALADLAEYAEAAAEANVRLETVNARSLDVVALNDAAMRMRETLRSDAGVLANRGLLDLKRLSKFKGRVGYKNVGFELLGWASVLHDVWPQIQNKTPLTEQELVAAKELAEQLIRAAGLREQLPAQIAGVARVRQQAVTLMITKYDQARRAVSYLRWNEGDAAAIAPSLYSGRRRRTNASLTTTRTRSAPLATTRKIAN